ncbi:IclR family transcriptional regulator [Alteromonas gilva]|uniref:IclR family transcriptional regulator n=1 Tax=Alteromonas gilva TaxID=2987522 RepID=A0ABT5KZF6_9ALTE|nr:IclR family transcriptional regulator [Alteromonas gilva]MDC8830140.1 IclR family transcriptional regulator [Alteromonas gilva]
MTEFSDLPRKKNDTNDRKFIESLARGLDVLRAFSQQGGVLGNQDLARITGLPKPTISRMTYTLSKLGYLSYSTQLEKYQLDAGVLALGYAYTSNLQVRRIAKPMMQALADRVNLSVGLTIRERLTMIYVENCRGDDAQALRMDVGSSLPIPTSAAGRAYLAGMPLEEREVVMKELETRAGDKWPQHKASLDNAFKCYEEYGFVTSFGEWDRAVNSVGVPIRLQDGRVMALNCGGPTYLVSEDMALNSVGPQLVHVARDIVGTGV